MKTPLEYQATECDCCSSSFVNAFRYLFDRKEIPPVIIKKIYNYTIDRDNARGTTREATVKLIEYFNEYVKNNEFKFEAIRKEGKVINTKFLSKEFKKNTVIILRLWSLYEHYVLVTKIDKEYIYLFDPYFDCPSTYDTDSDIEVISDNKNYNRKVKIDRFDLEDKERDYALGIKEKRECIIMRKN